MLRCSQEKQLNVHFCYNFIYDINYGYINSNLINNMCFFVSEDFLRKFITDYQVNLEKVDNLFLFLKCYIKIKSVI